MPQETVETTTDEELEPGVWTRNEEGELVPDYESTFPTINEGEVVLGVRGFLPASLVDIRRVQDLDEFLGKELRCKVIELNRSRNNVVLSRRAVLEDERKEMRQAILDRLNPGDVVEGQIIEVDAERRRLSLSLKRVEEGAAPRPRADGGESVHLTPHLDLSEDVF